MSRYSSLFLSISLALGMGTSFTANAQQPASPPAQQDESGWRKFSGSPPVQAQTAPPAMLPGQLVVPAGTWITIGVNDAISTNRNVAGDVFTASLVQPLVADGIVLARRGQMMGGRVVEVVKGGRVKGTARLGLELTELSLVDGRQVPVRTQLISYSSGRSSGRDATAIGTTTGTGAVIGAMAGGGAGAGIGALAGVAASTIGVLVTRGRAAEVYPEASITFRLLEPLTVSTGRAGAAFHAAGQQDYETHLVQRAAPVRVVQTAPLYWGLGYGYGFPHYYPSFWYGHGFRYYGGGSYRGPYGHYGRRR